MDVPRHPPLLLRRAQSDPDDVRAGPVDPGGDLLLLLGRQGTERRRVGADDPKALEASCHAEGEKVGDPGAAAVIEMPIAGAGGYRRQLQPPIGAVEADHVPPTGQPRPPDQRSEKRRVGQEWVWKCRSL